MVWKYEYKKFSETDLSDPFFDQLKADYPGTAHSTGFKEWFKKKANDKALVFEDGQGIGAFVYLKDEDEPIELEHKTLPAKPRVKIGTLRLAERNRGQRIGEGALGLALWRWQKTGRDEIYVTVFEKHTTLISLFEKFGFELSGRNKDGELVYLKNRRSIDYSSPYKSFPFIDPNFENAGYLVIDDNYHDTLFPYSTLANTLQDSVALSVTNGISKTYIGSPIQIPPFKVGEPIFIYRKFTGSGQKGFKSCITSLCVVTNVIVAKQNNTYYMTIDDLLQRIGNKSVFDENEIRNKYTNEKALVVIEMLYFAYFGAGNNVNWVWLNDNGLWPKAYPTTARLTHDQFNAILKEGNIDVQNVVID